MGMGSKSISYFFEILTATQLNNFNELSVCILGNQKVANHTLGYKYYIFKDLLVGKGFLRSENIDINGKDGSIILDLSMPLVQEGIVGMFDVVLNSGTSEHVMRNQWQVFKNMHDLLKNDGILIHILPEDVVGHGFWLYRESFFVWLSTICKYNIVDLRVTSQRYFQHLRKHYIFVALQKHTQSIFISEDQWKDPEREELGFNRHQDSYDKFILESMVKNRLGVNHG
jgi:SAM-dependent methyltransferase